MGRNTKAALAAFIEAGGDERGPAAGEVEVLTPYAVTPADVTGPFATTIPQDMIEQSKLPALDYATPLEMIAERYHVTPALVTALNPGVTIEPGQTLRVPNVPPMPAPAELKAAGSTQAKPAPQAGSKAAKVVVSRSKSTAQAFDEAGKIIFHAPVTSGSQRDPLPLGKWTVTAVTRNPTFHYNPDLFWDADPTHSKAKIPAGPNNPVGLIWIDISREHYGLHGTPEPGKVGHTTSHGCVRLTNWDAVRLAALVSKGTPVIFER
jgi:lipoprotein-anchoring transpeptidase ErfK/SrfK